MTPKLDPRVPARRARPLAGAAVAVLAGAALSGCLGKPGVEETWTRLDLHGASTQPYQVVTPGPATVSVRASVTFRRIVTGFAVAELRASSSLPIAATEVHPTAPRPRMATDIDAILARSVTCGRATRAVTGWDHLVQTIDFTFPAVVPATVDSAGVSLGPVTGLFLVTYLGSGDEIERADGTDSLVVTPFPSGPHRILPVGMELVVGNPTP